MDTTKYPHNCPSCNSASYNDPVWGKIYCTNPLCKHFDKTILEEEKNNKEEEVTPWGDFRIYYVPIYIYLNNPPVYNYTYSDNTGKCTYTGNTLTGF